MTSDDEIQARLAALADRDHVIGLEATNERLQRDLALAQERIAELERELVAVRESTTWRVGRIVTRPLGKLKNR